MHLVKPDASRPGAAAGGADQVSARPSTPPPLSPLGPLPSPPSPEHDRPSVRRLMAVMELTKPRITRLVTMTSLVGFVLSLRVRAGAHSNADLAVAALGCGLGTYLSSAGANALNQWLERVRDARMRRTASRPLPTGRLTAGGALTAGVALSVLGVGLLCVLCGPGAAMVSLSTILIYVLLYTPTKPLTPLSTLIGAVPGALPPLIGWSAAATLATGDRSWLAGLGEAGGWTLFVLMAVWQIPHFLALAWMYQDDYAAGGHRMLPLYDRTGRLTAGVTLGFTLMLIPATLAPAVFMPTLLGPVYIAVAAVSGAVFLAACIRLARQMSPVNARRVFIASVLHLPLLLAAMVAEVVVRAVL